MKKIFLCLVLVIFSCILFAQIKTTSPFIAKKKSGISASKLKEESAQKLASILQTLPSVIKAIAQNQELAMQRLTEYLENDKTCFWSKASVDQLVSCNKKIDIFQARIQKMNQEFHELILFLNSIAVADTQVSKKNNM